ncbi:MAG: D-alanyl-D-alanine carboxypeptidase [Syntrophomonadaceae bacterium]|jgi:D-alanyl-D-alanine carboxypeptidase (penicillin-binding protein 5/6)|nr:D-alanyl-D-alanine carboxypeptidase [Syntrophomonadaceae bacterium]
MPLVPKKYLTHILLIVLFSASFLLPIQNHALAVSNQPQVQGQAVILMDFHSGRILYAKNINQNMPPASVTKIMTALLVTENGDLDQVVEISPYAASTRESGLYLQAGEKMTRRQLLYACMLPSANDASVALAESVSGQEEDFVELMNQRAAELGLEDTHFCNPHGLHESDHYTTAYDLACLSRVAMQDPTFREIVSTSNIVIPGPPKEEDRSIWNQNRLLYRYDRAVGIKTGFTHQAGNCVVGAAQKNGMLLIAVSLNSPSVYQDLMNMLDYGFSNYHLVELEPSKETLLVKVKGGIENKLSLEPEQQLLIAAMDGEESELSCEFLPVAEVRAPVNQGDVLGLATIYLENQEIASIKLVAASSVEARVSGLMSIASGIAGIYKWALFILLLYWIGKRQKSQEVLKTILRPIVLSIMKRRTTRNNSLRQ